MILENQQFYNMVKTGNLSGAKDYLGTITRQILRENGFNNGIIETKPVNPSDCKPRSDAVGLSYFTYLEPESGAYVLGWRGEAPVSQYIAAGLAEIPFNIVASRSYTIKTEDLLYYPFPITKMIEDNTIYDMHEAQDFWMINNLAVPSVVRTGKFAVYNGSFDKLAMRLGFDFGPDSRLRMSKMVISDHLYNQLVTQGTEFFGSPLNSQVCTSGYIAQTFHNRTIIQTVKSSILTRNPFAPQDSSSIEINGVSAINGLSAPGAPRGTIPADPYYNIGVNLRAQPIGGQTANGFYPAADLYNVRFVLGFTNAVPAATAITRNGTGLDSTGGALPAHVAATAGPLGPTTKRWLGNAAFFFTDEESLGKSLLLKDVEYEIQQLDWKLKFQARQLWGAGFVNVNGVGMVVINPTI
jgi:hypothetical protein